MGKIQFLMDTGGHCFVCLQVAQSESNQPSGAGTAVMVTDDNPEHDDRHEPVSPKIFSFRNLCEYLKINLWEVSNEAMPLNSEAVPVLEKSELKGILCQGCTPLFQMFSKEFLELEGIKLKLTYRLKSIYEKMMAAETGDERATQKEERERLLRKQTALRNGFVEQLRRKTLERCSTVIETGHPLLMPTQTRVFVEEPSSTSEEATTPAQVQIAESAPGQMELLLLPEPLPEQGSTEDNDDQQLFQVAGTEGEEWTTSSYEEVQTENDTSPDIQEAETSNQEMVTPKAKQFECEYCSQRFRFSIARKRHMESNCIVRFPPSAIPPQEMEESIPEEPTSFECFVCQTIFPLEQQQPHYHGEKTLCHSCLVNFGTDGSLKIRRMKREIVEAEAEANDNDDDDVELDIDQNVLRESGLILITEDKRTESTAGKDEESASLLQPPRPRSSAASAVASTSTCAHSTNHIPETATPSTLNHSITHISEPGSVTPSNAGSLELESRSNRFSSRTAKYSSGRGDLYSMEFACDHCHKTFALRFQKDRHQRTCLELPQSELETPMDTNMNEDEGTQEKEKTQEAPEVVEPAEANTSPPSPNKKSGAATEILPAPGYPCKLCDKLFHSKKMFEKHLTSVHKTAKTNSKLQCKICRIKFKTIQGLRSHEKSHPLLERDQCPSCLKVFSSISNRNMHMRRSCPGKKRKVDAHDTPASESEVVTPKRKRAAVTKPKPSTPVKIDDQPPPNIDGPFDEEEIEMETESDPGVECEVCQEKVTIPEEHNCTYFETTLKFNEQGEVEGEQVTPKLPHLTINEPISSSQEPQSTQNPKTGDTRCGVCFKEFPRHKVFLNHYMSSHLSMTFNCDICGKEFYYRSDYTRHHRESHAGTRFKCEHCDKVFMQKGKLVEHHQSTHLEDEDDEPDDDQPQPSTSASSRTQEGTNGGRRSMTPLSSVSSHVQEKIKCGHCPREFKYEMNYQEHFKNVHSKDVQFKCTHRQCEKEFSDMSQLQRHKETAHTKMNGDGGLKCDICDKIFNHKSNLQAHKQAIHQGKKFSCPNCSKKFSSASSRSHHIAFKRCGNGNSGR